MGQGAGRRAVSEKVGPRAAVTRAPDNISSRSVGRAAQRDPFTRQAAVWTPLVILDGGSTSWTDPDVLIGIVYEYKIAWRYPPGVLANNSDIAVGYVCAGIGVELADHQGTVILMVDNTMAIPLAAELAQLESDMVGEGWTVIRHDVSRAAPVTSITTLVQGDYHAAPSEVRSVLLFGHGLPVISR